MRLLLWTATILAALLVINNSLSAAELPPCNHSSDGCTMEIALRDTSKIEDMFGATQKLRLKEWADYLRKNHLQAAQIEGHVYSSGRVEKDLQRGEAIAKFAEQFMYNLGVNSRQLDIISFGSE